MNLCFNDSVFFFVCHRLTFKLLLSLNVLVESLCFPEFVDFSRVPERRWFDPGVSGAVGPAGQRHGVRSSGVWRSSTHRGRVQEHERVAGFQHVVPRPLLFCESAAERGTELVQTREDHVRPHK